MQLSNALAHPAGLLSGEHSPFIPMFDVWLLLFSILALSLSRPQVWFGPWPNTRAYSPAPEVPKAVRKMMIKLTVACTLTSLMLHIARPADTQL
jgi:hypothetical protein